MGIDPGAKFTELGCKALEIGGQFLAAKSGANPLKSKENTAQSGGNNNTLLIAAAAALLLPKLLKK